MANLEKMNVESGNGTYARQPTRPGGHCRVLAAGTAEEHTIPQDASGRYAQRMTFSADTDFAVQYITEAEDEVVTNGTFASDTSWTKGTGWTIGSGVATSDASQAADSDLEQTFSGGLIEGMSYSVSFTVTAYTAGNVTAVIGGTEGTDRASAATFTQTIIAGSTDVIALRADANFAGSVDNFTVTPIAVAAADNQTGGAPDYNPTTVFLGGKYEKLSLYSASGGNVYMQFYL